MDFSLTRRQFLGGMGALALPLGRLGGAPNEPTPLKASSPDLGSVYELIDKLGFAPQVQKLN